MPHGLPHAAVLLRTTQAVGRQRLVVGAFADPACHAGEKLVGQLQQLGDPLVAEPVVHETALLFREHEAAVAKTSQVVRDVRLRQAGRRNDRPDRKRPLAEHLQDRKARRVGEPAKQLGVQGECTVWRCHKHDRVMIYGHMRRQ